jgi:RNA polymerase sigma factor (TIGR02999 family)
VPEESHGPGPGSFHYRPDVIEHLQRHGVRPTPHTPPQLVRDFVRDLYKYEIRRLRERMMANEFPRAEYSDRVEQLRRRYPVLSLLPRQFVLDTASAGDRVGTMAPAVSSPKDDRPDAGEAAAEVYNELRRIARGYMRRERPGQTLQATALVHEAYLALAGSGRPWNDKKHFLGIAARKMRQILVDRARARGADKRWAGINRVSLTESLAVAANEEASLPELDQALTRLEALDPEQGRIVELRYFVGLGIEETADVLGISPATLKRRWALARAWLYRELGGKP